jgi:ATP-dependent helicase/nuclease subunit B
LLPNAPREGGDDAEDGGPFTMRPVERLSVTGFKRYLQSPFHFYLERVRRVEAVEPLHNELNPMEFGNFCHHVLEVFGRDEEVRDLEDEAAIENVLMMIAEQTAAKWYGKSPALAVKVQLQSARQRLRAVAAVQAAERQAGWQIHEAELDLAEVGQMSIAGVIVSGRVDRLEKRDGVTRVLDYKTSDRAKTPRENHWKGIVSGVDYSLVPSYAFFEIEDRGKPKPCRWTDLQLPLYALALQAKFGESMEAGYLMMPKAVSETAVATLDLSDDVLAAARVCAEGVVADVKAGKFWPMVPQGEWDDFGAMHLGAPELTVDERHVEEKGGAS